MKIIVVICMCCIFGCEAPCNTTQKEAAAKFVIECMEGNGFTNANEHKSYCEKMMRRIYCDDNITAEMPITHKE